MPSLLATQTIRSQAALVRALTQVGHAVHQATVSRHLTELGVIKVGGAYRIPPPFQIAVPAAKTAITARGCLVVVHTASGFAAPMAIAIGAMENEGVLGMIASNDTVFVATSGPAVSRQLVHLLGSPNARPPRRTARVATR